MTSTCRGSTTCGTPTWSRPSTTRPPCASCGCSTSRRATRCWRATACPMPPSPQLPLLGISSICNLLAAIKTAQVLRVRRRTTCCSRRSPIRWISTGPAWSSCSEQHGPYTELAAADRLRALPAGHRDGPFAGAAVHRPEGDPQLEVLHLGRAAGQDRRGARRGCGARRSGRNLPGSCRGWTSRSGRSTATPDWAASRPGRDNETETREHDSGE